MKSVFGMTDSEPAFTVLMSVYNTPAQYLRQSIDSILTQSFSNFEFIIVDDGSGIHTKRELKAYEDFDSRIILLPLEANGGLTKALNLGLNLARGKYVARQDSDDISLPNRLYTAMQFLESNSKLAAAGSFVQIISPHGDISNTLIIEPNLHHIFTRNVLVHGSMVFRRNCINLAGGYNESMRYSQDYELYLKMIRQFNMQIGVTPVVLYLLRRHNESISNQRVFKQLYYSALAKTLTRSIGGRLSQQIILMKTLVLDYFLTHRMLIGPLFRKVLQIFRRRSGY